MTTEKENIDQVLVPSTSYSESSREESKPSEVTPESLQKNEVLPEIGTPTVKEIDLSDLIFGAVLESNPSPSSPKQETISDSSDTEVEPEMDISEGCAFCDISEVSLEKCHKICEIIYLKILNEPNSTDEEIINRIGLDQQENEKLAYKQVCDMVQLYVVDKKRSCYLKFFKRYYCKLAFPNAILISYRSLFAELLKTNEMGKMLLESFDKKIKIVTFQDQKIVLPFNAEIQESDLAMKSVDTDLLTAMKNVYQFIYNVCERDFYRREGPVPILWDDSDDSDSSIWYYDSDDGPSIDYDD